MLSGAASHAWPLVWRVLLSGVLVLLICTVALRVHRPSNEHHIGFIAPPRSLYSKQWLPFNANAVSSLAAWRMGLYSETLPESKVIIEDILHKRCSSLFPGDTPATSCYNGTMKVIHANKVLTLSFPGDSSKTVLQKIVDSAASDAYGEARSQALQDGFSPQQAQELAEAEERRVQGTNPHHILVDRLPLYAAWTVEVDPERLVAKGKSPQFNIETTADSIRSWLIQIEATRLVLEEALADDDYGEVVLPDDDLNSFEQRFPEIEEVETVSIQSQPGCLKTARYKPAARTAFQCSWPPVLKLFQVQLGKILRQGPFESNTSGAMAVPSERDIKVRPPAVRGNPPTPLLSSFPTPDRPAPHVASFRNYADPPTPAVPPEGSPPAEASGVDPGEELQAHRPVPTEEVTAPSLDRAQEAWDKANTIQKSLEAEIPDTKPPPPDMANYGTQRLAQVSEMSRQISDSYSELFQSRADAKHQLFEHVYDEADTLLHDRRVRQQLARVLALIKHLLGPEAQAQSVLNGIWRTYMHSAMLHSYTIACASLELRPQQCPLRSATSGLPKAAEELKQLSRSQQEDLWALVETVFNMTVPLAPVRPPVVHWDPRLRPDGVLVRGESVEGGSALWANGTGEPRPDLWVVHPGLVTGSGQDLGLAQMLQRANIRRYLALQVWQLDDHAADWGVILETEDVRPTHSHGHIGHYLRSMRVSGRRAQAKRAGDAAQGAPGEMSVGDLLASLLRARLASMDADERWIKDEDV